MTGRIPVLIVEDDKITQICLNAWLQKYAELDVVQAETIADARTKLASGYRPAVIMLDLQLGDGDGEDLFATIAALDAPPPQTIIVSATTDAKRLDRALATGPQPITVFSKPWNQEAMLAALGGGRALTLKNPKASP